jgi:NAD(P)-dependent dehydrogenase (short-subunit alcohol dehydrogenase family)
MKPGWGLSGKIAVITGGAGLLGRQFCRGFAEEGVSVAVVDCLGSAARKVAEGLRKEFGVPAVGISCDVANPRSVRAMVNNVVREFSRIDILINNAASKSGNPKAFFQPFETYSLRQWRKVMAVNLDGMFLVAQAVGRQMLQQKNGGSVVQTSSIYGRLGPDERIYRGSKYLGLKINTPAVYAASKAGVIGLSRYLATHWASQGIRVNTLVPGGVASGQNTAFQRRYGARVPLGRMAHVSEMCGAVLYLASDHSSYMTGQCLVVDGGLEAW